MKQKKSMSTEEYIEYTYYKSTTRTKNKSGDIFSVPPLNKTRNKKNLKPLKRKM